MNFRKLILALVLVLSVAACSSTDEKQRESEPADVLYQKAVSAMEEENYSEATKYFEEVERQHPYSEWSQKAQINGAYASYLDQRYDDADIALDRYIQLHPGAPDIDYAYYLKAQCYYEQISDVRRDQEMTTKALQALDTLIARYPGSKYARDSVLKRDLTHDHLAGKEMEIGRYYLNRDMVTAAINRFRVVITDYQTTSHVPEALHRLVESYLTLGLTQEALHVAAVLGHNYPGNKWYARTYALLDPDQRQQIVDDRGILDRTIDSLLRPD